jgi:hypothetical protein
MLPSFAISDVYGVTIDSQRRFVDSLGDRWMRKHGKR